MTPHHAGRPHIIVLGNEKGGSGKSTTAMHLVVALLHDGYKVGSIDCDARQGSFTRYVDNRKATAASMLVPLPLPRHIPVERSTSDSAVAAVTLSRSRLTETCMALTKRRAEFPVFVVSMERMETQSSSPIAF